MAGVTLLCASVDKIRNSWTNANPSRRFLGCGRYGQTNACNVFAWHDPKICDRARQVIPGLIGCISRYEDELEKRKKKMRLLVWFLVLSWVWMFAKDFLGFENGQQHL
ncbi:hypothetical protein ACH5RR_032586 [Cinchona calisaya]|uniref:Zinc finger GRF-type domain-containing protein n=1 Tax=Cinchona calisaya TaxID=153742 RepID=A0ABD2YMN9_9GENT